ncbi:hypothetical protein LshimejAT787_1105060 [Lyophyllum shimeji]|uniref:Uncharacterized protein n=1 Tax=Lyophyllum shimeji TaxID=47721 RepID=A0A9P3UTT5_LYOSH|nr:hypothetical protein LshimejAT787_1105060 [Lyophyllum shimeji]
MSGDREVGRSSTSIIRRKSPISPARPAANPTSWGRSGRDSIDYLFTTIAYQLAISIPGLRDIVQTLINPLQIWASAVAAAAAVTSTQPPLLTFLANDPSVVHKNISAINPLQALTAATAATPTQSRPPLTSTICQQGATKTSTTLVDDLLAKI